MEDETVIYPDWVYIDELEATDVERELADVLQNLGFHGRGVLHQDGIIAPIYLRQARALSTAKELKAHLVRLLTE
ncbi:MAG: hypothetical protein C4555_04430 [Dehalococcoidia bacterium]|nr:MAG: hypothetical protein C4555_04430 [Dehalococcoidia bacterium]